MEKITTEDRTQQENIEVLPSEPAVKTSKHRIGEEVLDSHIHDDHGDPHKAALEGADEETRVDWTTCAAVFFLGLTFLSSLGFTLNCFLSVATLVALQLQGSTNNVNWVAGGFSLSGSVAFAIAGQLSDYLGRKDVIVLGQAFLLVGHLTCATAQSFNQVIAGMVLLGVGTGICFVYVMSPSPYLVVCQCQSPHLLMSCTILYSIFAGVSEILPNKWRSLGIAWIEVKIAILALFGPLIARALTDRATWRWIFILGDIVGVFALAGTLLFYHPPRRVFQDRTKREVLYELDYMGIFLYTAGVTLFLLGLGWAGIQHPWRSAAVIAPLVIGLVLFILTFAWDFTRGPDTRPLFPYRLFRKFREFNSLVIIMFVSGLGHIACTTFIPQQILFVFTSNPITAGWYNVPAAVGGLFGGAVLGGLVPRMKHIPLQLLAANAIQALAGGLLALATPDRIAPGLFLQALVNVPFTWIIVIGYVTVGLHVPQRDIGLAYGLQGAMRYLGGAVGSTIFNTILNDRLPKALPPRVLAAVVPLGYPAQDVGKLIAALQSRVPARIAPFPSDVVAAAQDAIRWAYSDAFAYVWYSSIPFFVIACVVSLWVLDPSPYFTNHTAVTAGGENPVSRFRRGHGHDNDRDWEAAQEKDA